MAIGFDRSAGLSCIGGSSPWTRPQPRRLYSITVAVIAMIGADTMVKTNIVRSISYMTSEAGAPLKFMK